MGKVKVEDAKLVTLRCGCQFVVIGSWAAIVAPGMACVMSPCPEYRAIKEARYYIPEKKVEVSYEASHRCCCGRHDCDWCSPRFGPGN